jgi:TusA-related sulfurtransferase
MCGRTYEVSLGRMDEHSATTPAAFLSALTSRDFVQFALCLAPSVQARLSLPRGPEVRSGRDEVAQRFEGWFASASAFDVLDTSCEPIGSRHRLTWRFRVNRESRPAEVIEQLPFVDTTSDGVVAIDMLCSGFLPDEHPVIANVFDAQSMGCGDGLAQEFKRRLADLDMGESLTVVVSDPAAKEDLPSLARMMGQSVTSCSLQSDERLAITVEKRT